MAPSTPRLATRVLVPLLSACLLAAGCARGVLTDDPDGSATDDALAQDASGAMDTPAPPGDAGAMDALAPQDSPAGLDASGADAALDERDASTDATPAQDAAREAEAGPTCTQGAPCTTTCGTAGTTDCSGGGAGRCAPPPELCNGRDDNCDGRVDEIDCTHQVQCEVFNDGYASPTAPSDAVFVSAGSSACVPGGSSGTCRKWIGRCTALPAADGHTHQVTFSVFDDGLANLTPPSDAVYVPAARQACVPGGSAGVCHRWFGHGVTDLVQGHTHAVRCAVFDSGYTNMTGLADAVYWNGTQLCIPDGTSTGSCRQWFGRCVAE
jgi:hypothetical protein